MIGFRIAIASALLLSIVAVVPTPAAALPPCSNPTVSGAANVWVPAASNCVGVWLVLDFGIACTVGVGTVNVGPVWAAGGRGHGCETGVAVVVP